MTTVAPVNKSTEPSLIYDENAIFRAALVLGVIFLATCVYCVILCYRRSQSSRSRIRKYDIVSSRELQSGLAMDSDSEDDLFETSSSDRQKLVPSTS